MSNYGEELAYWYLRLNGFFPITDFVFHTIPYYADADILAVRPPNVREEIRVGHPLKNDTNIVTSSEESKRIFVYCEVKTSEDYEADKVFPDERNERILYTLRRFGFEDGTHLNGAVTCIEGDAIFKKILIAKKNNLINNSSSR